jgi:hypothetical protein
LPSIREAKSHNVLLHNDTVQLRVLNLVRTACLATKFSTSNKKQLYLYDSTLEYCKLDRDGTGASGPSGGCARDFVNFRKKIHPSRARGVAARV